MRKKNSYYLIARCRGTNDFQVVSINGNRENSLEEIDQFTVSFKDEKALEQKLQREGTLADSDIDFFIVNQVKVEDEFLLNTQEVLYEKAASIRDIADNSLHGRMDRSEPQIDYVLDMFANRMRQNPIFRENVLTGRTSIYKKYIKYFVATDQKRNSIKYNDGAWGRKSYPLIRNVIEAMLRGTTNYAVASDQMYRSLLKEELLRQTSPEYIPNQMIIPSFFQEEENNSSEDKLLEVLDTFESLPTEIISSNYDIAGVNTSLFSEIDEDDKKRLEAYLPQDLRVQLQTFLALRDSLDRVVDRNHVRIQNSVKRAQMNIIQMLKKPEMLNRAYDWCKLYNAYQDKMIGDVHGKRYRKRKES